MTTRWQASATHDGDTVIEIKTTGRSEKGGKVATRRVAVTIIRHDGCMGFPRALAPHRYGGGYEMRARAAQAGDTFTVTIDAPVITPESIAAIYRPSWANGQWNGWAQAEAMVPVTA